MFSDQLVECISAFAPPVNVPHHLGTRVNKKHAPLTPSDARDHPRQRFRSAKVSVIRLF